MLRPLVARASCPCSSSSCQPARIGFVSHDWHRIGVVGYLDGRHRHAGNWVCFARLVLPLHTPGQLTLFRTMAPVGRASPLANWGSSGFSVLAGTEEKRRGGSGGRRWSVPFGGTAVSFGRSWARVRSLVFGNQGRAEHPRREDPFDQRGADRGALLPPRGRLPKGSAPEPQLRHCRGRANLSSDAWERQETRPSPLNRLWRADEGDGDATAKRRKTRYRKSTWKEKTSVLAFG